MASPTPSIATSSFIDSEFASTHEFILYPVAKPLDFIKEGDHVFVTLKSDRGEGRAVAETTVLTEGKYAGRLRVRYVTDGSTFHVNPKRLHAVFGQDRAKPQIVITETTDGFRALARTQPAQDDFVVEIGCSYGIASALLGAAAKRVLALDVSKEALIKAREDFELLHPNVTFDMLDVLEERPRFREVAKGCDKLFVDIGGNRELEVVASIIPFLASLDIPLIVVKSEALYASAHKYLDSLAEKTANTNVVPNPRAWWDSLGDIAREDLMTRKFKNILPDSGEKGERFSRHPLKYPIRLTSEGVTICRYHNYDECVRKEAKESFKQCMFDHTHCNFCGKEGHRAKECTEPL